MPRKPFRLLKTDPNITADSTFGASWRDTWSWECPENVSVELAKGDLFFAILYDSADAVYLGPDALVKVVVRSPGGEDVTRVYGGDDGANYIKSSEVQDRNLMAKLNIDHPVVVKPRWKIVVMTYDSTGMDAASIATSHFQLQTHKLVN